MCFFFFFFSKNTYSEHTNLLNSKVLGPGLWWAPSFSIETMKKYFCCLFFFFFFFFLVIAKVVAKVGLSVPLILAYFELILIQF